MHNSLKIYIKQSQGIVCSLYAQLHEDICFQQVSEAPASLPPCPPAETAEINQCDLTDALIDTERTQHDDKEFGKIVRE